jgi:hypothetical protein
MLMSLPLVIPDELTKLGKGDKEDGKMILLSELVGHPITSCITHPPRVFVPSTLMLNSISWYLGGDIAWLHVILGLGPCASTNFCCICEATLEQLRCNKKKKVMDEKKAKAEVKAKGPPKLRTVSSLKKAADDMKEPTTTKAAAKRAIINGGGTIHEPLVPFEVEGRIVPPPLHIMMGLCMDLLHEIEVICSKRDELVKGKGVVDPNDAKRKEVLKKIELKKEEKERLAKKLQVKKRAFDNMMDVRAAQVKSLPHVLLLIPSLPSSSSPSCSLFVNLSDSVGI